MMASLRRMAIAGASPARVSRAFRSGAPFLLVSAAIALFPGRALSSGSCNVQIWLVQGTQGQDVTGKTSTWYIGEQIELLAKYTPPAGTSITGQSWSVGGTTVGGFSDGASGGYTPTNFQNEIDTTFYWLAEGNSLQATYTVNFSDGSSASADAYFNLLGPTSVSISPDPPAMGAWQISVGPDLQIGCQLPTCTHGIQFNGSATSPQYQTGSYEWVQIITTYSGTLTTPPFSGYPNGYEYSCNATTGLDTQVPYAAGLEATDSPLLGLDDSNYVAETFSFGATMYFMWTPSTSSTIPAPLGYVTWGGAAGATYADDTWTIQSGSTESANSLLSTTTGPSWASTFEASNGWSCH